MGLICYYLAQLRRNTAVTKPQTDDTSLLDILSLGRKPTIVGALS
jgi:hypothetical protein